MFGWYSLWVMHSVPEHQQRERKAEEKKKRRRNCDSVVGLAKKDMSCSKALASTYINTKSSKREIAMNLSHRISFRLLFFLAPFNLRSTFTRFHIFSLGAMMLLLFIRSVVLSPSSSNIYAFYFLRHLFFLLQPASFPFATVLFHIFLPIRVLSISAFVAITLISYFSVTQILLSLSNRVFVCAFHIFFLTLSFLLTILLVCMSFLFIYFLYELFVLSEFEYVCASVFCPNEMLFFASPAKL